MAETIFRYINGVLRPLKVNQVTATSQSVTTVSQSRQLPKHTLAADHYRTPHAFTIPNVTCHCCGAKVFYYEHPNGARVLFDQLGPPWPKHPCYEAGQTNKRPANNAVAATTRPRWLNDGWQPLLYEKQILLQSGSAIRLQASTDNYQVIFDIPLVTLQQRHIQTEQISKLLMQAKMTRGKVLIQLHNGVQYFEIVTKNIRQIYSKAMPTPNAAPSPKANRTPQALTDKQLASLTKLDVKIQCHSENKRWLVNLSHHDQQHTLTFKEKTFEPLKAYVENLELLVGKPNKKRNCVVFLLDSTRSFYINTVISEDVIRAISNAPEKSFYCNLNTDVTAHVEQLEAVTISSHSPTSMRVRGKLAGENIVIKVDNRLLRLGESTKKIAMGDIQISLRRVTDPGESEADFAIYIHKSGDIISNRPRGYVSRLTRSDSKQVGRDSSASRVVGHKAVPVTLSSVDLSQDNQIFLVVNDKQQGYRLRLHSTAQTVTDQIEMLLLNPASHDAHLVKRAEHSYQFHIDGRFVVMASVEDVFAVPTNRRSAESTKTHDDATQTGNTATMLLPDCIQRRSHLERHGLGAALLDAVKQIKKQP